MVTDTPPFRVFIQARMSSIRFPGKVLAPLYGVPLIDNLLSRVKSVVPREQIAVLTSSLMSDDPLVRYVAWRNYRVFCGPLDNVFKRFQLALKEMPCEWVVRLSGDSPLLEPKVLSFMLGRIHEYPDADVITNVSPMRTFPKGQSVEIFHASIFSMIDTEQMTTEEQGHVGPYFYNREFTQVPMPPRYRVVGVGRPPGMTFPLDNSCVDTIEDLRRLEHA